MKKLLTTACLFVVTVVAAVSVWGQTPTPVPPPEIQWGVKIPIRDGVKLHGNLYRPRDTREKLPVILFMTPYVADAQHAFASAFAKNGYVVLVVDVRGRGNSGGNFVPFENEGRDGYDIVEWAARQPWSNGKVAMWGGSYLGMVQWLTLREKPPHLVTVIPMVAPRFTRNANIVGSYSVQWLAYVSGKTRNENLWNDQQYWRSCFTKLRDNHLPFNTLDSVCGFPSPIFQKQLSNPTQDQYVDSFLPTPDEFKRIDLPILEMAVYFDPNDLDNYREHTKYASPEAAARHYLVIGPWEHFLMVTSKSSQVGPWKFGEASVVDLIKLYTEWYDWTMKNGPKPAFLKKNIAYYAIGPEEWRYADSLDAIPTTSRKFYLGSKGGQLSGQQPGSLTEAAIPDSSPDSYKYDPLEIDAYGLGRVVLYETGPFAEDTDIVGQMKVVAWMSIDVPDTDFLVWIEERDPAGRVVGPVYNDVIRARYRESLRKEKLVKPGEINRYEFNNLKWRYRRIRKGNHLRLNILSDLGPYFQKNYNSGGVVAKETAKDARTATVKVYHDSKYPSFLEIPIAGVVRQPVTLPKWTPAGRGITQPELSPDGSRVVFQALGHLWEQPINGGQARRLVEGGDGTEADPAFSPDGRQLAFVRRAQGKRAIHILEFQSGKTRTVAPATECGYHQLSWSLHGELIASTSCDHDILAIDTVGLSVRVLAKTKDWVYWEPYPQLSADGTTLYFQANIPGSGPALYKLRMEDGAKPESLAPSLGDGFLMKMHGQWLARSILNSSGIHLSKLGDVSGESSNTRIFTDPEGREFSFTPDGSALLYVAGNKLWLQPLKGGAPREIPIRLELPAP